MKSVNNIPLNNVNPFFIPFEHIVIDYLAKIMAYLNYAL